MPRPRLTLLPDKAETAGTINKGPLDQLVNIGRGLKRAFDEKVKEVLGDDSMFRSSSSSPSSSSTSFQPDQVPNLGDAGMRSGIRTRLRPRLVID